MGYNLVTNSEYCASMVQSFLHENVILYYSHIPTAGIALLLGLIVFFKNRRDLASQLFFLMTVVFALWSLFDLILWSSPDSRKTMFFWSMINFLETMVSALTLYFVYVFTEKKDIPVKVKILFIALFLPFLFLLPTSFNISGFNATLCEAQQGKAINYFYFLEGVFFMTILVYSVRKYFSPKTVARHQFLLLATGALLFMLSFSGANIAGSIAAVMNPDDPDNWKILQYGLFGMPVFLASITYLIVKYHAFNMRVFAAQAIVLGLIALIGSQLFYVREWSHYVLVGITFTLAGGFGIVLIRSVKSEIQRKEELEVLTKELSAANAELKRLDTAKSEFISIASHQLRTPLTAVRGFLSLLIEGAYGKLEPKIAETLNKVTVANNRLMSLVENLLNISRIEAGRIQYQFAPTQIESIVDELADMFLLAATTKGIRFKVKKPKQPLPLLPLDAAKIRETLSNLIDNAIKYTEHGSVTIAYELLEGRVAVSITDTGMGMEEEQLSRLFKKFERGAEAVRVNVSSTGLGLYVGRKFAEAHGGTVVASSEGRGKGSCFVLELPIASQKS